MRGAARFGEASNTITETSEGRDPLADRNSWKVLNGLAREMNVVVTNYKTPGSMGPGVLYNKASAPQSGAVLK